MRVGVLGTGMVGRAIASKLVDLGHDVLMGSRSAGNESAVGWAEAAGGGAGQGTFAEAAAHGEIVFNCTNEQGSWTRSPPRARRTSRARCSWTSRTRSTRPGACRRACSSPERTASASGSSAPFRTRVS